MSKDGQLAKDFELPVQAWFGKPVERLAKDLHRFFQSRIQAQRKADEMGNVLPPPDARRDFQEFICRFAQAIREFESPGDILVRGEATIDLEPRILCLDEPNWDESDMRHVISKRDLDDPDPFGPPRPKRMRVWDREAVKMGPVIEIVDYIMAEADCIVGTSIVLSI
jgi:hypothetical protein